MPHGLLSRPPLGAMRVLSEDELMREEMRRAAERVDVMNREGVIRKPRGMFEHLDPSPYDSGIPALMTPEAKSQRYLEQQMGLGPENIVRGGGLLGRGVGLLGAIIPKKLSRDVLNRMNRTMKAKGYDVRGAEDTRTILGSMVREGEIWHTDWLAAYNKAVKGEGLAQSVRAARKTSRAELKNVDWQRLRQLGTTRDLTEAGYIKKNGALVDLSGKREGGSPGGRAFDHREVGTGTMGMQELQKYGYVRMDMSSGSMDMVVQPTAEQLKVIRRIIGKHNGEVIIDLGGGLGKFKGDYYLPPSREFMREYPIGTKAERIIADINRFFGGDDPLPLWGKFQ
jgi:hypothetical protein